MSCSLSVDSRGALLLGLYGGIEAVSGMATGLMLVGSLPAGALYGAVKFAATISLPEFTGSKWVPSENTAIKICFIAAPILAGLVAMSLVGVSLTPLTALAFPAVQILLGVGPTNYLRSQYL